MAKAKEERNWEAEKPWDAGNYKKIAAKLAAGVCRRFIGMAGSGLKNCLRTPSVPSKIHHLSERLRLWLARCVKKSKLFSAKGLKHRRT